MTSSFSSASGSRLSPPPPRAVADALGVKTLTIDWLAGDGSDRCYFRVKSPESKNSYVLMQLSGTDLENLRRGSYDWVDISKILSDFNITVPKPVATIQEHGALIIDDYGDEMLETTALQLNQQGKIEAVLPLYDECLELLSKLIAIRPSGSPSWTKRSFDEARFIWELDFFVTKYLEGVCHRPLSSKERQSFQDDSKLLAKFLAAGSKYFVHRDFHSRNVMVKDQKIALIDFQDARLGPVSYDLVSLCFDSYIPFSNDTRRGLLESGIKKFARDFGKSVEEECRGQWKPMLLQRQLKAIGSFGYLTVDKQKGDYLKNVSPALMTMTGGVVFDSRWPFISGKLIDIIEENMPTRLGVSSKGNIL